MSETTTVRVSPDIDSTRVAVADEVTTVVAAMTADTTTVTVSGISGPQGAPGLSGGAFVHTQNNAALVWLVQHNLGYEPGGIEVEDVDGNRRSPQVVHVNDTKVLLYFMDLTAGKARLS